MDFYESVEKKGQKQFRTQGVKSQNLSLSLCFFFLPPSLCRVKLFEFHQDHGDRPNECQRSSVFVENSEYGSRHPEDSSRYYK